VRESAEAVRRAVERLYPDVRFDIDGSHEAKVAIERQDLDEILGNLIENAAKYGGGSVFVTIDAEPEDRRCVLWIEDDGMGIPEKDRIRIFDRGARLDTGKPGTGLGLAIVRDVAEIYGGGAELLESEDLGGLHVVLRLPRARTATARRRRSTSARGSSSPSGGATRPARPSTRPPPPSARRSHRRSRTCQSSASGRRIASRTLTLGSARCSRPVRAATRSEQCVAVATRGESPRRCSGDGDGDSGGVYVASARPRTCGALYLRLSEKGPVQGDGC